MHCCAIPSSQSVCPLAPYCVYVHVQNIVLQFFFIYHFSVHCYIDNSNSQAKKSGWNFKSKYKFRSIEVLSKHFLVHNWLQSLWTKIHLYLDSYYNVQGECARNVWGFQGLEQPFLSEISLTVIWKLLKCDQIWLFYSGTPFSTKKKTLFNPFLHNDAFWGLF